MRWGDKHGGYGEHYWDYNHAGHGNDDHGEESAQEAQYAPVPVSAESNQESDTYYRRKRQFAPGIQINDDVEYISDSARAVIESGATSRHGGNYRRVPEFQRTKREFPANLIYEIVAGKAVGENSE